MPQRIEEAGAQAGDQAVTVYCSLRLAAFAGVDDPEDAGLIIRRGDLDFVGATIVVALCKGESAIGVRYYLLHEINVTACPLITNSTACPLYIFPLGSDLLLGSMQGVDGSFDLRADSVECLAQIVGELHA